MVVITGAAGGIGRALAARFAPRAARVALLDRDAEALARATSALPRPDRGARRPCDVSDLAACQAAIAAVCAAWGGIDVLVNNAGISHRSLLADTAPAVLRRVMEVNFFGAVNCTRAALAAPDSSARGVIVVISSVAGFAPLVGRTGLRGQQARAARLLRHAARRARGKGVARAAGVPLLHRHGDRPPRCRAMAARGARPAVGGLLTPEHVAAAIVAGCQGRTRQLVLGGVGRLSFWVSRLAPRAYEALMLAKQGAEFGLGG